MSFMQDTVDASMDIWKRYLSHPFLTELATGTLSMDQFIDYTIDDTIYLIAYARVMAIGMYKSETLDEMSVFYEVLSFVNNQENSTRAIYLKEAGLCDEEVQKMKPRKENKAYMDFMLDIANTSEIPEILMAILPCMFSYYYIAKELVNQYPGVKSTKYWPFVRDYCSDSYYDSCVQWGKFAESKCANLSEEHKEDLKKIFRIASEHEMHFWDMAYGTR